MEKNIRKEKEELSTGPRLLKRWKKAFLGKLRPRHLANILNNISSIDVDKAEKEEMAKKRSFLKNTCCDWLINCISQPIRNNGLALGKKWKSS